MSLDAQNIVGTIAPPSAITFFGTFSTSDTKVMEITRNGIWVNPDVSVDDAANAVLRALDSYIKNLVDGAVRAEKREWVWLTDQDYEDIMREKTYWYEVAKAVELKAKEKNT